MIRRFLKNEQGNVALVFAGSMMLICSAVGVSVDYARVLNDKHKAQNILDASVFSVATQYQEHGKRNLSKRAGKQHFTTSLMDADPSNVEFDISNKQISAKYTGTTDHYFLSIFTSKSSQWEIEANIKYSQAFITDYALAIDVSTSMTTNNLFDPLKRHLKRFSEQAFAKANPGDVSVSLIPYSNSVAFSDEYKKWLDPNDGYSIADEFIGCFEYESIANRNILDTDLHSNRIAAFERRLQPQRRNLPLCPEEGSLVSFYNQTEEDLAEKISDLTTAHGTNTAEALLWARRILAPEWQSIFGQSNTFPRSYKPEHNKVLILLTDGRPFQTSSVASGNKAQEQVDGKIFGLAEFKEVCQQIKDQGNIDLYTIAYGDLMNTEQRNQVRSCIAGGGRSFWASASSLSNVFRKILAMNSELALTK